MKDFVENRFTAFAVTALALVFFLLTPMCAEALTINDLFNDYYDKNSVPVLCYHDVYATDDFDDDLGVSARNLEAHLQYLKDNGWNVVGLSQYINYVEAEEAAVPPKTILLSFDDGYESIYTLVFPLLKKFNFPAMFAVVGSWQDGLDPPEEKKLVSWGQLREMEASGLADVVSHSYDLHYYEVANPQGDDFPVANIRYWEDGKYEEKDDYLERITEDFADMEESFKKSLGHKPLAIVWPYGECNADAVGIAKAAGMRASFILSDRQNVAAQKHSLDYAGRYMMHQNLNVEGFITLLNEELHNTIKLYSYTNASQVDIDELYVSGDMEAMDKNIDRLIRELERFDVNAVFLQAFADDEGSGNIKSVYFYTTHAPVKADVFSHVATRLRDSGFLVIAWMNTLSCQWLIDKDKGNMVVPIYEEEDGWYDRASPFSGKTLEALLPLFDDLSAYSKFDGVLFQDDLYLGEFEDFSSHGKAAFLKQFNTVLGKDAFSDEKLMAAYGKYKTRTLIDLSNALMAQVRRNIPYAVSMRNIYSSPILIPESEAEHAQNYRDFISNYDYTVIMAYPHMEAPKANPYKWLTKLISKAVAYGGAENMDKVIIKIQTYDWEREKWLSNREIVKSLRLLESFDLKHSAIYPHKAVKR